MWAKSYSAHHIIWIKILKYHNSYQSNYFLLEYFNFIRIFCQILYLYLFFSLGQNNIFVSIVTVKANKENAISIKKKKGIRKKFHVANQKMTRGKQWCSPSREGSPAEASCEPEGRRTRNHVISKDVQGKQNIVVWRWGGGIGEVEVGSPSQL